MNLTTFNPQLPVLLVVYMSWTHKMRVMSKQTVYRLNSSSDKELHYLVDDLLDSIVKQCPYESSTVLYTVIQSDQVLYEGEHRVKAQATA